MLDIVWDSGVYEQHPRRWKNVCRYGGSGQLLSMLDNWTVFGAPLSCYPKPLAPHRSCSVYLAAQMYTLEPAEHSQQYTKCSFVYIHTKTLVCVCEVHNKRNVRLSKC